MRLERRARDEAAPALGVLFAGVLAVAGAGAAVWTGLGLPGPVCHLKQWTGIPCPSCGSTRMVRALLDGDVLGALSWNPLVFATLGGIAIWGCASGLRWIAGAPGWRLVLGRVERFVLRLLGAAALLLGWAYVIWRGV